MSKTGTGSKPGLVGKWFHSIVNGKIEWQGQVIGNPAPGYYLVQLYEWFAGSPNLLRIAKLEDMIAWLFYNSNEEMNLSHDHGAAREGGPYRPNRPSSALSSVPENG